MFLAAIALRFAFPHTAYRHQRKLDERGQGIALKSISNNLRQTINPKDIVDDAIHNFSRSYQQYANATQEVSGNISFDEETPEPNPYVTRIDVGIVEHYKVDNEKTTLLTSDTENW